MSYDPSEIVPANQKEVTNWDVCYACGSDKIYKYDGHGPICKRCCNGGPPPIKVEPKTGRNESCPCKSGKKYKKCCLNKI